jgi:hypothetical protein
MRFILLFSILWLLLTSCAKPTDPSNVDGGDSFNPDDLIEVLIQSQTAGTDVTAENPDLISANPAELNFGTISASTGKIKGIKITNKTTSSKSITFEDIIPPFSVFLNKCTAPLNPNQSCNVYIKIDSSWFTMDGPIAPVQIKIKYGASVNDNLPILLKATISNGTNSPNGWSLTPEMDIGFDSTFTLGVNQGTRIFKFYNPGSVAAPLTGIDLTLTPYYKIAVNRCSGFLLPKQRCSIILLYENFEYQYPLNYHGILRYIKNNNGDREGFDTYLKQVVSSETYVSTYSSYAANTVTNACNGTQQALRSITACNKLSDSSSVSTSLCSDPFPFKTYKSPAGQGNATSIANGTRYENCPIGQTTGTYVYQCNLNYILVGTSCIPLFTNNESSYMTMSVGAQRVINNGYIIHNFIGNELNKPVQNNGYIIWSGELK